MSFTYDEEATLAFMAHSAAVDLFNGQVTFYAAVCVGSDEEPNASHGGQVCHDATEALETAAYLNSLGHPCRYLPMAIGCHPETLVETLRPPREDV